MALFSPLAAVLTFDDELQFAFIVDNVVANTTSLFFIFTIETYALFFSLSLFCAWKLRTKQQTAKSTLTVCNFQFFTGFPHTYRQRPEWNRPLSLKCQLVSKTRRDCVACFVHFFYESHCSLLIVCFEHMRVPRRTNDTKIQSGARRRVYSFPIQPGPSQKKVRLNFWPLSRWRKNNLSDFSHLGVKKVDLCPIP